MERTTNVESPGIETMPAIRPEMVGPPGNKGVIMERDVFDRIHAASQQCKGVTLSASDVFLLMECMGDDFGRFQSELQTWTDRLIEAKRIEDREAE